MIGTTQNLPAWDYYRELGQSGMHWVCWGSPFDELEWIRSDNHAGARLATAHLIERGYRQIACIGCRSLARSASSRSATTAMPSAWPKRA